MDLIELCMRAVMEDREQCKLFIRALPEANTPKVIEDYDKAWRRRFAAQVELETATEDLVKVQDDLVKSLRSLWNDLEIATALSDKELHEMLLKSEEMG